MIFITLNDYNSDKRESPKLLVCFSSLLKSKSKIYTVCSSLQVNLNELDQQMEQIKEMFVKKQEMMKKMSSANAPDPAQLAA